jgi:hypothetical protein
MASVNIPCESKRVEVLFRVGRGVGDGGEGYLLTSYVHSNILLKTFLMNLLWSSFLIGFYCVFYDGNHV